MNSIDGQLTSYSYDELTDMRRKLQNENAKLKTELTLLREQRREEIKMRLFAAKIKKGEIVITPDAIVFKDTEEDIDRRIKECDEWEQLAELGRLSLTTRAMVCSNNDFIKRGNACERHCTNYKFCRLRAELLAGEK
jgi:hypothetical protein